MSESQYDQIHQDNLESAKLEADALVKAAKILAAAKVSSSIWKWISGSLVAVIFAIVSTYTVVAREYVTKDDFRDLKNLVEKSADNLNRLIGTVETMQNRR